MTTSINSVCITGNVGNDPDLRSTSAGTSVLRFNVAVNDRVNVDGEWTDRASWVTCVMFGNRADAVSRFLTKGSRVAVHGKLRESTWQAQDGSKRSKLEVMVGEVDVTRPKQGARQDAYEQTDLYAESIPF